MPTAEEYRKMQDTRNVIDHFKGTDTEEVKAALAPYRTQLKLAMEGFSSDFNCSQLMRSSNAFLCDRVYYVGGTTRKWDKRGAVGANHYENFHIMLDLNEFKQELLSLETRLVIMEYDADAKNLMDYEWDPNSCMLVGNESDGVSDEILGWVKNGEVPGDIVYIPQMGSVRSLNAATSAGIAIYDYVNKMRPTVPEWAVPS